MKRMRFATVLSLALAVGLLASCAAVVAPAPESAIPPRPGVQAKQAWQAEWEALQAAARKEGKVVISAGRAGDIRTEIGPVLTEKFGIAIEAVLGKPSEVSAKVIKERSAGLYTLDMFLTSPVTGLGGLRTEGAVESLDRTIFLPEVLDPKVWYNGELPWVDRGRLMIAPLAAPNSPIFINTDMVGRDEIKSYRDLLNPKWRGKIAYADPTKAGSGIEFFTAMAEGIMSLDYLRELAKQEPVMSRDDNILIEWTAKGKYPILIGGSTSAAQRFFDAGAPIKKVTPVEGTYLTTGAAAFLLMKNAPHPNAVKLLINWWLTREGMTYLSETYGYQSARVDVPTHFLDPDSIRKPGAKYIDTNSEETARKTIEYQTLAREVFAASLK
ncbi:MAG: extracellular solute-binding protein [Chloroflexi bacterium]|nr:extracellular solute-binding protein [Chloroflexota bacterium]